jgi:N-acylneuraminate cytidylyltransferase/CMP-N,N'-diacetyllegionaminic acid synthase
MLSSERVLCLIPARGGSRGLSGKNVKPICGRPLIAWTVDAALASEYVDDVVVSTDDDQITQAALDAGARVPFRRSTELASDTAKMADVVVDALDRLAADGRVFGLVVLLQPTSPLRTATDVDSALRRMTETGADSVVSVCLAEHSPLLAGTLPADGSLANFLPPVASTANRQELPIHYRLNGAVYVAKVREFRETKSFLGPRAFAYIMPPDRSVDIDSALDFKMAESLLSARDL